MDLEIADVAAFLKVSEQTIEEWLIEGKIPAYRLGGKYRFSRSEIQDWMMRQKQSESPLPSSPDFSLYRALYRGQVLHGNFGTEKEEIIQNAILQMSEELPKNIGNPAQLFIERERMMSTALGRGIAVPHTREFLIDGPYSMVSILFLETPIDWGSLDGKPVATLFFLMATSDKQHLQLLARIAHLTNSPKVLTFLESKPNKADLLNAMKDFETKLRNH